MNYSECSIQKELFRKNYSEWNIQNELFRIYYSEWTIKNELFWIYYSEWTIQNWLFRMNFFIKRNLKINLFFAKLFQMMFYINTANWLKPVSKFLWIRENKPMWNFLSRIMIINIKYNIVFAIYKHSFCTLCTFLTLS